MKNVIEQNLYTSMDKIKPNMLNSILADCQTIVKEEPEVIETVEKKATTWNWYKPALAMAMALIVVFTGFTTYNTHMNGLIESRVGIDVNPSIEIQVNRNNKVINVVPINEDGKIIIGDMDFKGSDMKVTVNALVGSMLSNGYISELKNSILISIDNKDPEKAKQLQEEISKEIDKILKGGSLEPAVISQVIDEDNQELIDLANQYNISEGKAKLIREIVEDSKYTYQDLTKLSINELTLLAAKKENMTVTQTGTASKKAYIEEQKAIEEALKKANVKEADVVNKKVEIDYDKGVMIYEVDFYTADGKYEIEVNAVDGSIVGMETEKRTGNTPTTNNQTTAQTPTYTPTPTSNPSNNNAMQNALNNAGVSSDVATQKKVEYDAEDNKYDVEFKANGYEYDYEIDATTGKIIESDKEVDDDAPVAQPQTPPQTQQNYNNAIQSAQQQAGVTNAQQVEVDYDDDEGTYEVEFKANGNEYSYDVNAGGQVVHEEVEKDDDHYEPASQQQTSQQPTQQHHDHDDDHDDHDDDDDDD